MSSTDTITTTASSTYYCVTITSCDCATSSTTGGFYGGSYSVTVTAPPPRRILVQMPRRWSKKTLLAWAVLINRETKTGWIAEMVICGEVIVTDPNIDRRDFADFVPLLEWRASDADKRKIRAFIKSHKQ